MAARPDGIYLEQWYLRVDAMLEGFAHVGANVRPITATPHVIGHVGGVRANHD
jgi:hypothetical protein